MEGIIILDGPDASGKTTLQEHLVKHYGAIPIHLTYNKDVASRMFDYQTENMLKAIELSQDNLVVVDRHWISEKIYAKVFRGGSPWPMMGQMMDRVWRKHAAIYVMCLPLNYDTGIKRHKENIDASHPYDDVKFQELLAEYYDFAVDFALRKDVVQYCLETHGQHLDDFCNYVIGRVDNWRYHQYRKALSTDDQSILGHAYDAKFLFVGERVNKKDNYFEWPFYEHRNASLFLTECLAKIEAPETNIMWANVRTGDGTLNPHIQHLALEKRLKVVAFGDAAAKTLKEMWGIKDFVKLPHPQWVKRFNHTENFLLQLDGVLRRPLWK